MLWAAFVVNGLFTHTGMVVTLSERVTIQSYQLLG